MIRIETEFDKVIIDTEDGDHLELTNSDAAFVVEVLAGHLRRVLAKVEYELKEE